MPVMEQPSSAPTDQWPAPSGPPSLLPPPVRPVPQPHPSPPSIPPPPSPPARERRRVWLLGFAVAAAVAFGAAAVLVTRTGGERDVTWADSRTNPHMLASDGEVLCASGLDSDLYCLDLDGGTERFAADLDGSPASSPTIVGDTVLVGTDSGLYAHSVDGEEIWSSDSWALTNQTRPAHLPVVGDTAAAIDGPTSSADTLVGVDVATGEPRWRLDWDGDATSQDEGQTEISMFSELLTDGERFYVTTETTPPYERERRPRGPAMAVVAIDPSTGDEAWRWEMSSGSTSFPAATEVALLPDASSAAFVVESGGRAGRLVVLDTATGELRWDEPLGDSASSIAYVDGVLVVADGTSTRGYDADGDEVWAAELPDDSEVGLGGLVATGGRLFLATYDVVEIDPADGTNRRLLEGASAGHVLVVDDALVVADMSGVRSVPLPAPL